MEKATQGSAKYKRKLTTRSLTVYKYICSVNNGKRIRIDYIHIYKGNLYLAVNLPLVKTDHDQSAAAHILYIYTYTIMFQIKKSHTRIFFRF